MYTSSYNSRKQRPHRVNTTRVRPAALQHLFLSLLLPNLAFHPDTRVRVTKSRALFPFPISCAWQDSEDSPGQVSSNTRILMIIVVAALINWIETSNSGGGRNFDRLPVERAIFRNFKIANVKSYEVQFFDFLNLRTCFSFFYLNSNFRFFFQFQHKLFENFAHLIFFEFWSFFEIINF